jgi:hypothetical protein
MEARARLDAAAATRVENWLRRCPPIARRRPCGYFNEDGTVRQISQNPSLLDTAMANGVMLTSADRGLDKFTFNPDGTVFLLSTGVHFKVNELGLRRILFSGDPNDPSSAVLSFERHGRLGDDAPAAICPLFG